MIIKKGTKKDLQIYGLIAKYGIIFWGITNKGGLVGTNFQRIYFLRKEVSAMENFIKMFLTMIFIPILVNVISNLITDMIKAHSSKFADEESGLNSSDEELLINFLSRSLT